MNLFNLLAEEAGGGGGYENYKDPFAVCSEPDIEKTLPIIGAVIKFLLVLIPIILVIFGLMDLMKAVMASKDDEIKNSQKLLIKRIIYTIVAFLVIALVSGLITLIDSDSSEGLVKCIDLLL